MTRETRTTIETSDITSVEFECRDCGARAVLKLETLDRVPVYCAKCEKQWVIHNSEAHSRLHNFLQRMKDYAKANNEPYILRFEINSEAASD